MRTHPTPDHPALPRLRCGPMLVAALLASQLSLAAQQQDPPSQTAAAAAATSARSDSVPAPQPQVRNQRDSIDYPKDVLPEDLVGRLALKDLRSRLLQNRPLYVLVNPRLADGPQLERLVTEWDKAGQPLPQGIAGELCHQNSLGVTAASHALSEVVKRFFDVFFNVAEPIADLAQLREEALEGDRAIVAAVDASFGGSVGQPNTIGVVLSLQLLRVKVDVSSKPFKITQIEKLFMGLADGSAALPATAGGAAASSDEVLRSFRSAVVDALRNKLAVYLWGDEQLVTHAWLGTAAKVDVVAQPRAAGGTR